MLKDEWTDCELIDTMKFVRSLAFLSSLAVVAAAHAQLGVAGNFNVYTLGNDTQSNVDVLGLVAVGGNANFTNYTINSDHDSLYSGYAAIVGGSYSNSIGTVNGGIFGGSSITASNPTINGNLASNGTVSLSSYGTVSGNIAYGSTFTNPNTTVTGSTTHTSTTAPINFTSTNSYLTSYSSFLNSLTANGTTNQQISTLTLTGTNSTLDIFNVTAAQLASESTLNISAPSGATVLVNVSGSSVALSSGGMNFSGVNENQVLFNFAGATTLSMSSFNGSILAPNAATTFNSGQMNGQLIVGSLSGGGEEHDVMFAGALPPTPSPEPFTLAMPIVLGGAWLRKRAKSKNA